MSFIPPKNITGQYPCQTSEFFSLSPKKEKYHQTIPFQPLGSWESGSISLYIYILTFNLTYYFIYNLTHRRETLTCSRFHDRDAVVGYFCYFSSFFLFDWFLIYKHKLFVTFLHTLAFNHCYFLHCSWVEIHWKYWHVWHAGIFIYAGEHSWLHSEHSNAISSTDCRRTSLYHIGGGSWKRMMMMMIWS